MFSLISGLLKSLEEEPKISILLVGCDGSGKTSFLERCKVTDLRRNRKAPSGKPVVKSNSDNNHSNGTCNGNHSSNGVSSPSPNDEPKVHGPPIGDIAEEERHTFCPSPAHYRHTVVLDEEVVTESKKTPDDENGENKDNDDNPAEDGDVIESSNGSEKKQVKKKFIPKDDHPDVDIDIRLGSKMFPLHMIRPTIGMNLAQLEAFGCKCSFWDLGGKEQMRPLWERYYADTDAIVFVVDITSSPSKMDEARKIFHSLKKNEQLAGVPILVFANKVDTFAHYDTPTSTTSEDENSDDNSTNSNDNISEVVSNLIRRLEIYPPEQQRDLVFNNGELHMNDLYKQDYGIIDLDGHHLIRLCYGSARTGAGIRNAIEWLIVTAKSQILCK